MPAGKTEQHKLLTKVMKLCYLLLQCVNLHTNFS